jgi:hypothetical protein
MEANDLKIGTKLIQKDTGFKCVIYRHKEDCTAFKLCWEDYTNNDIPWYHIGRILAEFDLFEPLTNDNVNHPSHYNQGGIETIDYIKSRLTREEFQGFCKGNILKYCSRSNLKNGEEDLRKMNYYSNELMQVLDEKV